MKKLIINIGQEAVVGATFDSSGKEQVIDRVFEFSSLPYYNNHGMIDFPRLVTGIKKYMPKNLKSLDIDLILPTYATDVEYVDFVEVPDAKSGVDKGVSTKVVYIGEKQTKKISQKISYNNRILTNIIQSFHKEHLNVVRVLSNISCYHNFMAVFNQGDVFSGSEHKTHICVVWGTSKIYYIIMMGNLPVEVRVSDLRLTDVYKDIVSMGGNLPLYQILKVMDSFTLNTKPEVGILLELNESQDVDAGVGGNVNRFFDGQNTITLSDSMIDLIKERFVYFINDMIREIRTLYDYVGHKYSSSGSVHVCTNSKLIDECICKTLSDTFPIEYFISDGIMNVYDTKFSIRSMSDFTDKYNPILGCVIESMKKGGDFYDV